MYKVDITIRATPSKYWASVDFKDKKGEVHQRQIKTDREASMQSNYLQALIDALEILNRPCILNIYSSSDYVTVPFQRGKECRSVAPDPCRPGTAFGKIHISERQEAAMKKKHYERTDYGLRIPIEPEEIRKVKDRINIGDIAEERVYVEDEARQRVAKKVRYCVVGKYRHLITLQPIEGCGLKTESDTYVEILMNERRDKRSTVRNIRIL